MTEGSPAAAGQSPQSPGAAVEATESAVAGHAVPGEAVAGQAVASEAVPGDAQAPPGDVPSAAVLVRAARISASPVSRPSGLWSPVLASVRRRLVELRSDPAALLSASIVTVGTGLAVTVARQVVRSSRIGGLGGVPSSPAPVRLSGVVEVLHRQSGPEHIVHHVVHHVVHHHVVHQHVARLAGPGSAPTQP